jgi:integrase
MSVRERKWESKDGVRTAWVCQWDDADGKQRQKTFTRKRAAKAHEVEVRGELEDGTHVPDSQSVTFGTAGKFWLDRKRINKNAKSSQVTYEVYLRVHLAPLTIPPDQPNSWRGELADFKLSRLTSPICDAIWLRLREIKPAYTAKRSFAAFKSILKDARRRGLMKRNPAESVIMDGIDRAKPPLQIGVDIPDKSDIRAMLDAAIPDRARRRRGKGNLPFCIWRSYTVIVLDVATGMRAEELRALLWKYVHLTDGFIRVMHGLDADGLLAGPKTDSSYRDLLIPPDVVEDLCRWREICPDTTPDALVFPTLTGKPMSHRGLLDQIWYPLLDDVGMKSEDGRYKYVFHGLRHFYASIMIEAGLRPKRVQKLLGHATLSMTMDIYGHLFPESEAETEMIHGAVSAVLVGRQDDKKAQNHDMAERTGGNLGVIEAVP